MNWVQRKIYRYNVTFGLYMLDWWERCIVNAIIMLLIWFICKSALAYAGWQSSMEEYISLELNREPQLTALEEIMSKVDL